MEEPKEGTEITETAEKKPLSDYEWNIKYVGRSLNFWACLLISVITAMVSILSTSSLNDNSSSTVFIIFVGILIIVFAIYVYGFWGVISAGLAALLFCLTIKTTIWGVLLNIAANTIQAFLIYLVFKFTNIDESVNEKNGILTDYKFILLALGGAFVVFSFLFNRFLMLYIFSGLLVFFAVVFSIKDKSPKKILYVLSVCLLPSLAGGGINSCFELTQENCTFASWYESAAVWFFSNTILFGTFGYLLLGLFGRFKEQSAQWQRKKFSFRLMTIKELSIKSSTIIYYIATLLWNVLFYVMYIIGWLQNNTLVYLFPWTVGNIFFLINLGFTRRDEIGRMTHEKAFDWFEQRAVVAEKNTQMLIAVIAFLLPLCANYLGVISESIAFVFILNITTAVVSIGLIWIPKNDVRIMEIVKNLKTVFHLYTLSLLLLNAVMIINQGTALA